MMDRSSTGRLLDSREYDTLARYLASAEKTWGAVAYYTSESQEATEMRDEMVAAFGYAATFLL
jgi:hypothetical protein